MKIHTGRFLYRLWRADSTPRGLAFEMPQDIPMGHQQQDLGQYLVPVAEIEKETGIAFFPDLRPPMKLNLELEKATGLW
jgi:DNA/RNA endonuclease G (NUC1)